MKRIRHITASWSLAFGLLISLAGCGDAGPLGTCTANFSGSAIGSISEPGVPQSACNCTNYWVSDGSCTSTSWQPNT